MAHANGATGFVHVSAIGLDAASSAAYARGKALGEQKVLEGFPKATILRPSIVFGKDDNFLNLFGQMIGMAPALPVFGPERGYSWFMWTMWPRRSRWRWKIRRGMVDMSTSWAVPNS